MADTNSYDYFLTFFMPLFLQIFHALCPCGNDVAEKLFDLGCILGMLHAKIEKVANTMPKRGIFLVENRKFLLKNRILVEK